MDRPVAVQCSADEESPTMKEPVCIFTQPNQVTISLKAVECPGLAGRPGAKATDRQRTNTDKLFADSIYVYTPRSVQARPEAKTHAAAAVLLTADGGEKKI